MNLALALNGWWIDQLRLMSRPTLAKSKKQARDIAARFKEGTLAPETPRRTCVKPAIPHLRILHSKGWTLRPAAAHLGVSFQHLHEVLRGSRASRSLAGRVAKLPVRKETL